MRDAIKFRITAAGRAAIPQPPASLHAAFSHVAVGRGDAAKPDNAAGYQPTGAETALKREFMRAALGGGVKPAPDQISFAALVDGDATGWINEIGLYLQDGTLFGLWSEDVTVVQRVVDGENIYGAPLGYKALGVPYTLAALISVQDFSIDNLDIVVNGPPINITINRYETQISDLLALVTAIYRELRDLEAARRSDEARILSTIGRVRVLEGN